MKKCLTILFALIMSCTMLIPQSVFAADESAVTVTDPYMQVKFTELKEQDALVFPDTMSAVTFSTPKYGNGLLLSGKIADLTSGRISIDADFDLDRNPAGRVSFDGLCDRGVEVKVNVYIDDEEDPVTSFDLGCQMGSKDWANAGDHTASIYDRRMTGRHRLSFDFEITSSKKKTDILIRSIELSESSMPVLYFNIDESKGSIAAMNGSADHSEECYGSMDLEVPDGYTCEYTGTSQKALSGVALAYMRGRGNSTWLADKKPYKVKFDKKQDLFGMGANKHWILLANRYDNSFVRNRMTYWLGAQLGMDYTPQCVPVDLVLNDMYCGSYLLCEQIRIGDSRVAIDDLDENEETMARTDLPFISGGYLLSMDPFEKDDEHSFQTKRGVDMYIESPSFETVENESQVNYIKGYIQAVEDAVFGTGFKDNDGKSYKEYLDIDAAADYWWLQEFSANGDAYGSGSTFLYKTRDSDTESGKLFWGPLWDFDYVAWGDLAYGEEAPSGFDNASMIWFDRMRRDKSFCDKLVDRWADLDPLLDEITEEGGLLDQYYEEYKIAQKYDFEKWGSYGESYDDEGGNSKIYTYEEEIEQLRTWIEQRHDWVSDNIDELTPQTYTVIFKANNKVIQKYTVSSGDTLAKLPEIPAKKGYFSKGWFDNNAGFLDAGDEITCNMVLTPVYIKNSEVVKATDLYFGSDVQCAALYDDEEDNYYEPLYTVMPAEADDQRVTWKSSDTSKATVGADGTVFLKKTGTVTITGTLSSGKHASYKLVIYDGSDLEPPYAESISLNRKTVTLKPDGYTQVKATTTPKVSLFNLSWMSLDPEIADVDNNGVITAYSPGSTVVMVIDTEVEIYALCKVVVSKPAVRLKAPGGRNVNISYGKKKATFSWKKVKGARQYKVAYRQAGKSKWNVKSTKSLKYTFKKLKAGKMYEFRVAAVGTGGTGKWSGISRRYMKKASASVKAGKKKATVKWKKDKKASGYQIRYSYKKNMSGARTVKVTAGKKKYIIRKLSKGKTVYIQVRSFRKYKGKTYLGVLSSVRKVKVR